LVQKPLNLTKTISAFAVADGLKSVSLRETVLVITLPVLTDVIKDEATPAIKPRADEPIPLSL